MKYALITGASSKIGQQIALKLSNEFHIYVHYNKRKEMVERLPNTSMVQADLSAPDGVRQLLEQIHHPIDIIIHNSGNSFYGLMTDMTDADVEKMIQLNVTSPFLLTKKLLSAMIAKKSGSIVVISSIWGSVGASCEVLYSMVKGGQNTFVKALAKELAPCNIRVNAIAAGAVDSGMMDVFTEEERKNVCEEIPLGRLAKPEEIADAVFFLISDKSSYITGHILSVNGGWYL